MHSWHSCLDTLGCFDEDIDIKMNFGMFDYFGRNVYLELILLFCFETVFKVLKNTLFDDKVLTLIKNMLKDYWIIF